MKKMILSVFAMIIVSAALFAGGSSEEKESAGVDGASVKVFVSIEPQRYFVEQIAGERAEVEVMVSPGKSPATYEPTPRQVQKLGEADLFFTIGVPFETVFLQTVRENLPDLPLYATDAEIEKRFLAAHSHEEDEHEGEHGEEHEEDEHDYEDEHEDDHEDAHENEEDLEHQGALDPHVWMDPVLVIEQGRIIRDGLIEADPEGRESYKAGYDAFVGELEVLHEELKDILAPVEGSTLFVYHPAFGYFGDRYGLKQVAVETGGREPGPAMLEEIIEHAREDNAKVIFVQPEFSQSSAQAVARAINGAVVPVGTLRADYMTNMRELADAVRKGLKGE